MKRKKMQAKTERFEMRLDQDVIDQIDAWRGQQTDLPSRAEAVRRLVEAALTLSDTKQVRINDGEKLIFFMLRDL